jgi:tetratricopeptide (TPR) repeat protein
MSGAVALYSLLVVAAPAADARQHYKDGLAHYDRGEYDEAIAEFRQAWDATHAPPLLFDLAQAYRRKGDGAQALRLYQAYLAAFPQAPNREDVEARIRALEDGEPIRPVPAQPASRPPARTLAAAGPIGPPMGPLDLAATPPGHTKKVTGVVLGAGGLAALGVAVYFTARARDASDEIERLAAQQGKWDAQARSTYADGQSAQRTANILYVAGGVTAAAGALLYYLGWREAREGGGFALAPTPAGGAALTFSRRF